MSGTTSSPRGDAGRANPSTPAPWATGFRIGFEDTTARERQVFFARSGVRLVEFCPPYRDPRVRPAGRGGEARVAGRVAADEGRVSARLQAFRSRCWWAVWRADRRRDERGATGPELRHLRGDDLPHPGAADRRVPELARYLNQFIQRVCSSQKKKKKKKKKNAPPAGARAGAAASRWRTVLPCRLNGEDGRSLLMLSLTAPARRQLDRPGRAADAQRLRPIYDREHEQTIGTLHVTADRADRWAGVERSRRHDAAQLHCHNDAIVVLAMFAAFAARLALRLSRLRKAVNRR